MGEAELAWSHSNRGSNKDSSAVHNCPDTARGHAARECELEFVLRVSACSNSLNSLDGNERGNHEDKLEEAGAVVVVVVVVCIRVHQNHYVIDNVCMWGWDLL